jgi:hypothetical protein
MVLGLSLETFTQIHTVITLVMLVSGFVVVFGMLGSHRLGGWTALFLLTAVLTSVTGFGFPFTKLLPSHILGIISLVVLAVTIPALYLFHLAGPWRWIYVIGVVLALWFDVFVGIVQAFQKIPALTPLAPTQSEPPFAIAQGAALVIFVILGIAAAIKFHPAPDISVYGRA